MKAPSLETLTLRSHQLSPRSWLWAQVSLETHREILRVKASPGETASGLNVHHPRVKASLHFLSRYPPPKARTFFFEILKKQSIWLHTFSQTIKTTSLLRKFCPCNLQLFASRLHNVVAIKKRKIQIELLEKHPPQYRQYSNLILQIQM